MIIRVDDPTKDKFEYLARRAGQTVSEVIRDLMRNYIKEKDMAAYIDDLWNEMSAQARASGFTVKDVPRIIKEVREEMKKAKQKDEGCD